VITVFDNTFATPVCQRPLQRGVDLVVHSASKYIGGHGDAIGGVIVGSRAWIDRIRRELLVSLGGVMSPFTAWLMHRGLETLPLRVDRHCRTAQTLAEFLEGHPKVEKVHYPGLPSSPDHELARRQMEGFGGVLSFEVRGGSEAARRVVNRLGIAAIAVSLGDTRTLVSLPAAMAQRALRPEERVRGSVPDGLIRVAVGLEAVEDLIEDFETALDG
jgi:methionine-gamma-lyase